MALPNSLSTYNFPNAYDDLVDAFTGTIKYISASTGSNSNTGNSATTAYLTIEYALAQNTSATATMFVILAGTYVVTPQAFGNSYATFALGDNNYTRIFVGAPGLVKIQFTAAGGYGPYPVDFKNSSSACYGIIFERNNGGKTASYEVALFCGTNSVGKVEGNFYNCAFTETNANNAWSLQYDNESTITSQVNNCTFKFGGSGTADYTGGAGLVFNNSVFNQAIPTSSSTRNTTLASQTVSASYVTTGVTDRGVYSGTYAWNGTTTLPEPGLYTASASVVSGNIFDITYVHTSSTATVGYTITGVTSADINNASLTGNFSVTNSSATLSITTISKLLATNTFTITAGAYSLAVTITPSFPCEILIIAGGGSGGNHNTTNGNGGGGAGGVRQISASLSGSLAVVVGGGGSAIPNATSLSGVKGSNSSLGNYIAEGGGGGASTGVAVSAAVQNGGSGGGNAYGISGYGTGISGQGFAGGQLSSAYTGAGGGGAGGAGVNGSGSSPGGNGGIGITNTWTGSTLYLAGGGGGGGNSSERAGDGFYGGGRGSGTTSYYSYNVYTNEVNATTKGSGIPTAVVNSGGGGGGGSYWAANGGWANGSGAGGSGRVMVRYAGTPVAVGGTITQSGGYTLHQFLTSGTLDTPSPGLASSHPTTAYWGETITFTYWADVADGGTIAYTISGVTSPQINGASLTGNFTFSGLLATVTVTLPAQITNTTATMTFVSGGTTITISISNITGFTSSSPGTYWGGTTTLTASTRGLTNGGTVPYAITGVTSAQISNTSLTGSMLNVLAGYGYSALFNGSTSKLSIPSSADFAFGTGDFTIEFWIKTTDTAFEVVTQTTTGSPNWALMITSGNLYWQNGFAAASLYVIALSSLTANPISGSWTHVAITRNGSGTGNLKFWINGVGQTAHTSADTTNYTGQGPIQISGPGNQYGYLTGNISNLRIVKGVAVYTGNFTVPTASLTATQSSGTNISAITGTQTSLLCCQSATIIDNSVAARTITNTDVTASDVAPFGNNSLAAVGGGTAILTVVTNPTESIFNTATMVTTVAGIARSVTVRTGQPRLSQNASTSIQTPVYIDTEVTDIHSEALEAKVDTVPTVNAVIEANKLVTNLNGFVAAPTYAYSSGEEIVTEEQGAATISQVWTLS
jgi:hypothetical protein